ncbi:MAG: hypothetical protein DRN27_06870 [Thermoplasmata archaeon]|nr:MAG: hypothetical protein DRN27_06870 [Thermoplasmata archaeon]
MNRKMKAMAMVGLMIIVGFAGLVQAKAPEGKDKTLEAIVEGNIILTPSIKEEVHGNLYYSVVFGYYFFLYVDDLDWTYLMQYNGKYWYGWHITPTRTYEAKGSFNMLQQNGDLFSGVIKSGIGNFQICGEITWV